MKDKWISIKDRLPETNNSILLFANDVVIQGRYEERMWLSQHIVFDARNVTHWMYLPEPPKEENNEK